MHKSMELRKNLYSFRRREGLVDNFVFLFHVSSLPSFPLHHTTYEYIISCFFHLEPYIKTLRNTGGKKNVFCLRGLSLVYMTQLDALCIFEK